MEAVLPLPGKPTPHSYHPPTRRCPSWPSVVNFVIDLYLTAGQRV